MWIEGRIAVECDEADDDACVLGSEFWGSGMKAFELQVENDDRDARAGNAVAEGGCANCVDGREGKRGGDLMTM